MSNRTQRIHVFRNLVKKKWNKKWEEFIFNNKDKSEYFMLNLSRSVNLTLDLINNHPNERWNWMFISLNKAIKFKDIIENIHLPWDWHWLSTNPSIEMKHVLDNPDKSWDWIELSKNPGITISRNGTSRKGH